MKKNILFICTVLMAGSVHSDTETHWGYSGQDGPENWAQLSPDNFACNGKNQSPIDLSDFTEAELAPITFSYKTRGFEIVNNGHTVQINYRKGNSIEADDRVFDLLQIHFHAPSENHINGHSYPLEAHLVHSDENGNLAVVAVMFEEGAENKGLSRAWQMMPVNAGDKHPLSANVEGNDLLPGQRDYYRFNGSLTTPPCSEGVLWLVMKQTVTASGKQVDAFKQVLHEPNNRPLQAENARAILK